MKRKSLYFVVVCFGILLFVIYYRNGFIRNQEQVLNDVLVENFIGKSIEEVQSYSKKYGIELVVKYQYHHSIEKGKVISQEKDQGTIIKRGSNLEIVVSRGQFPITVYQDNRVNELGNVPIMMYHGIIDKKDSDTDYIGGNVDKDGYNRTVESFRKDLEFYYQAGYRMVRLSDYVDGIIDVELGKSPIILTFDDGNDNNFKVLGEENGELVIDSNCAVGVLEEFKKKYPDYGVTATFFVNQGLFGQEEYNEKILKWLVRHGYDIGNHTMTHVDFTKIGREDTMKEVGGVYQLLGKIIPDLYVPIVALPFGSPYKEGHSNYSAIVDGTYLGEEYHTKAALRVGWEAEVSCFDETFNPLFLKRIRAYDNNGVDFDIEMNFKLLESGRYISDGDKDTIVVLESERDKVRTMEGFEVISY